MRSDSKKEQLNTEELKQGSGKAASEKTSQYADIPRVTKGEIPKEPGEKPKKKKKTHKRTNYLLRFVIFVLVFIGVYFGLKSSYFNVSSIQVIGNSYYTKAQITELSGIENGKNIFFENDFTQARDGLLATPYISYAEIKRALPGTVIISVEERKEYATVPYGESYIIIDSDGLVLRNTQIKPDLPILEGLTVNVAKEGLALSVEQSYLLTSGLELLKEADNLGFFFSQISLDSVYSKAYIYYDDYYCRGTLENLISGLPKIIEAATIQYSQGITKGVFIVESGGYVSFSPQLE